MTHTHTFAGAYFQSNFQRDPSASDFLARIYDELRPTYTGSLAEGIKWDHDRTKYSLMLIGGSGTSTRFHRDWTEAGNVLYELSGKGKSWPRTASATWIFIVPGQEAAVDKYLVSHCCTLNIPVLLSVGKNITQTFSPPMHLESVLETVDAITTVNWSHTQEECFASIDRQVHHTGLLLPLCSFM